MTKRKTQKKTQKTTRHGARAGQSGHLKRTKRATAAPVKTLTEQNDRLRAEQKAAFLATYARVGTVKAACDQAKVGRSTVCDWVLADKDFAALFSEAREAATDVCEREARRRGVDGVLEPVYYQGDVVGHVRNTDAAVRILVSKMAADNPLWGVPRIHGELCKLGIEVSERTVSRLVRRPRRPPSQTWRTNA